MLSILAITVVLIFIIVNIEIMPIVLRLIDQIVNPRQTVLPEAEGLGLCWLVIEGSLSDL